jgi:hypothetical protein
MKRFIQLAAVAATFALCINAPAQGAQPVTTSVQIPLAGTVFVPLSDGSTDQVALSGIVHVLTYFQPEGQPQQPPLRIHINLDQVSGVGDLTGLRYNATGANRVNLPAIPPDPLNLGFNLLPDGPPITYPAGPDHPARYFVHPYLQSGHGCVVERGHRVDVGAGAVSRALTLALSRTGGRGCRNARLIRMSF